MRWGVGSGAVVTVAAGWALMAVVAWAGGAGAGVSVAPLVGQVTTVLRVKTDKPSFTVTLIRRAAILTSSPVSVVTTFAKVATSPTWVKKPIFLTDPVPVLSPVR